jgi:hypothetical protein
MECGFTGNKRIKWRKLTMDNSRYSPMNRWGEAIRVLAPSASYHTDGEEILEWLTPDIPQPSEEAIQAKMDEFEAEYEATQYQRDRESEYPSMADQLDYIYHNGIAKWKSDMVKPVKDAHPKP